MTLASLGVEIRGISGFDQGSAALDKFAAMSKKAETAAASLTAKADAAAARVGRMFQADTHAARFAQQIDKSTRSLHGFEAIAARAGAEAAHLTRQMEQLSGREIRDNDIQAFGRELDQLRAKFNPLFAASKAYENELNEINRAHALGAINAMEQASAIARLDAQYELAARSANKMAVAGRSAAQTAHTTNLMFQAQDIAMMTAMGQAPMMLALQQGSQVGPILQQMAQVGGMRAALGGVGTALASLISPINLATLGIIALGAAGVQAFMSWVQSAGPVKRTMQDHREWLSNILAGYDEIQSAVDKYLETANRLPAPLARLQVGDEMSAVQAQLDGLRASIENFGLDFSSALPFGIGEQFNEDIKIVQQLRDEYLSGSKDAVQFAESLRLITSNNNVSPFVRELAQRLDEMAREAVQGEVRLETLRIVMQQMANQAITTAQHVQMLNSTFAMLGTGNWQNGGLQNILDEGTSALESLRNLVPEIRSTQEIAAGFRDTVIANLPTAEARAEAQALFDLVVKNEAILKGRREAEKAAGKKNPYDELTKGARDFIAAQEPEQRALFMTSEASARMRYEQQLLNQAKNDNIKLSASQSAELMGLAAQMAATEQATRNLTEIYNFGAGLTTSFFSDVTSHLREQASEWQNIGDVARSVWEGIGIAGANALQKIADKALENAAMGIWDWIFGAAMGGITGGLGGGMFGRSMSTPLGFGGTGGFHPAFPSFAGGGHTGYGPRSGGLDGLGGFMAMLHPNETVVDHTRPYAANQNQANDNLRGGDLHLHINGSNLNEQQLARAIAEGIREYDASLAPKVEAKFRTMQNDPRAADGGW